MAKPVAERDAKQIAVWAVKRGVGRAVERDVVRAENQDFGWAAVVFLLGM